MIDDVYNIEEEVSKLRLSVKSQVLSEMRDWLSKVKDSSKTIGEIAFELSIAKQNKIKSLSPTTENRLSNAKITTLEMIINEEVECKF
jgi:hypothetical protein